MLGKLSMVTGPNKDFNPDYLILECCSHHYAASKESMRLLTQVCYLLKSELLVICLVQSLWSLV